MSTLDPFSDFYLPGPAARDSEDERAATDMPLRKQRDADGDEWHEDAMKHDDDDDNEEYLEIADDAEAETAAVIAWDDGDDWSDAGNNPGNDYRDADEDFDSEAPTERLSAVSSGEGAAGHGYRRGNLLIAGLIAVSLAVLGWYLLQPQTLPIKQVSIEGEFRELSRQELQTLVGGQLQGGFFSVDVGALRQAVTANPWVREVQVQRVWPDALKVTVHEQVPVARWNDSGLVNDAGHYFEPQTTTVFTQLPQLNGPSGLQTQLTQRLQQLQAALIPLQLQVSELSLSERRAWSFNTRSGLQVVLGRDDFDARLARFIELVPASLGERLTDAAYIDMRYTNGFAVRFSDDAPASGDEAARTQPANTTQDKPGQNNPGQNNQGNGAA